MNKIVAEQLNKVKEADLSNFDKETNTYTIKKKVQIKIIEGKYYLIKLNDSLLNNCDVNYILMNNFNNGNIPKNNYYLAEIANKIGNMIKINGVAYDYVNKQRLQLFWVGWLPIKEIEVLEEV